MFYLNKFLLCFVVVHRVPCCVICVTGCFRPNARVTGCFRPNASHMVRPASVVLKPCDVVSELKGLLEKRLPGFQWDGSDYQRPHRNQAADKDGLLLYLEPLQKLLKLAPTGFPTHTSLRESFELCDEKFKIFDDKSHGRHTTAARAADVWRKMCADIYQMAKGGVYDASLRPLVACITLKEKSAATSAASPSEHAGAKTPTRQDDASTSAASRSPAAPSSTSIQVADVSSMSPDFDDHDFDDIEIVHVRCNCPDCRIAIPPPQSGGQKRAQEAQAADAPSPPPPHPARRIRIRCKMPEALTGSTAAKPKVVKVAKKAKCSRKKVAKKSKSSRKSTHRRLAQGKKLRANDRDMELPVRVVTRRPKGDKAGESYIMQSSETNKFIVCCNGRNHSEYLAIIKHLADLIGQQRIKTVNSAKNFVAKWVATGQPFST